MGVQPLSASMVSLSCTTIHDVTTSISSIVRSILGARMFPQYIPRMSCHTVELDAWIGNMSKLPFMALVESKVSLDLLGMTLLTATSLPVTPCIRAQGLHLCTE